MKSILENKRGAGGLAVVSIIALVVALGVVAYMFVGQSTQPSQGVDPETGIACSAEVTPNLTIKAYDKDNPGTALTESTNLYRAKGDTLWSTFTAGTGFSVESLQELDIVMGITTSDFTDNAYGQKFSYTVPCRENPTVEKEVANDEVETSLSATFYNADGDAGAETFSAGETQTVSIKLKAGVDEYFGNPFIDGNVNVLVLELNSTTMDKPEQVYLADGTDLKETTVPSRQTLAAGNVYYAYELPAIGDKEVEVKMDLNADDSNAPAVDDTAYLFAGNYYLDAETSEIKVGVENEENAAVGTDASDSVAIDVTA